MKSFAPFLALGLLLAACSSPNISVPALPEWQAPADQTLVSAQQVASVAAAMFPRVPITFSDATYSLVNRDWLDRYVAWEWQAAKAVGIEYVPNSFDCDKFALGFFEFATLAASKAGLHATPLVARLVVQYDATQRHELNGVVTDRGMFVVEPQPDAGPFRITPLEKYNRPVLAIIFGDFSPAGARIAPPAALPYRQFLPDPRSTPGAVDPHVTVEQLRHPAFIKAARNVPAAEKNRVYANYHVATRRPGEFEIDHLISLELGGSNDIANLWPQLYHGLWNAHQKDRLENELHRRVLAGTIDLAEAQRRIARDWIALYREIFPTDVSAAGVPKNVKRQANAEPDND